MTPAGWGPVRQLGHVVESIDAAVETWSRQARVGPWLIMRNCELHATYRGQPTKPLLDVAFSYRGDIQIELIQQKNAAPSPYRPFIDAKRFGLHHIAFMSEQIDAAAAAGEGAGLELVFDIRMPGGGRYVYFAVPGNDTFVEVLEATATMKQMFELGVPAARAWDGTGKPTVLDLGGGKTS